MYQLYIDSCAKDGGIYHYELNEKGETRFINKTHCPEPMYSIIRDGEIYTLLKCPYKENSDSALLVHKMDGDLIGKQLLFTSTLGVEACHLEKAGEDIFAVNYTSGSIFKTPDILKIHKDREFKSEKVDLKRQEMPHTHCVILTPDKKYIAVTDLGLDKIFIYDFDFNLVSETKVEDGLGPRHIIFDGEILYCLCELGNKLLSFKYEGGNLTYISEIDTLPEDFKGFSTAAAVKIPGDKIYCSNRGSNTIAVFKKNKGYFENIGFIDVCGNWPRDFDIIDDILVCCNEISGTVSLFRLDEKGLSEKPFETLKIPNALCVVIK